jgi:hypothetical protein
MKTMRRNTLMLALAGAVSMPAVVLADTPAQPAYPAYGPGMWQQITPEQRQQMWEYMQRQGYGPGMMMGPGMQQPFTPEQRQRMWESMQRQGYGPGMMMGPRMMGPAMWQPMTPEQYKKWWDETHPAKPEGK